jgi:hypothetical protein
VQGRRARSRRRLYVLSIAVPAIAAHLGLTLDTEGAPINLTTGPLVETVAAHIYARHTENRYTPWDDLSPASRAPWITTAQGVVQSTTAEADRFRTLWDRHGKNDLLAERDAAQAALGRVNEFAEQHQKS